MPRYIVVPMRSPKIGKGFPVFSGIWSTFKISNPEIAVALMRKRKRSLPWNLVVVATVLLCLLAFVEHYKNWYSLKDGNLKILSGAYYQKIPLVQVDSLLLVERLPEMERQSGFSWKAREKGVFRDSVRALRVHVFVDDLRQQKIKLVHRDSLVLYMNLGDSLETQRLFAELQLGLDALAGDRP